jgi:hypothetical protein
MLDAFSRRGFTFFRASPVSRDIMLAASGAGPTSTRSRRVCRRTIGAIFAEGDLTPLSCRLARIRQQMASGSAAIRHRIHAFVRGRSAILLPLAWCSREVIRPLAPGFFDDQPVRLAAR